KAGELGIEIGLFNSPGWSQSGGPWVKPQQAMRYLASTETQITGGKEIAIQLPKPEGDFQDVRVIAFRAPKDYGQSLADVTPKVSATPSLANLNQLVDHDKNTEVKLPQQQQSVITLSAP